MYIWCHFIIRRNWLIESWRVTQSNVLSNRPITNPLFVPRQMSRLRVRQLGETTTLNPPHATSRLRFQYRVSFPVSHHTPNRRKMVRGRSRLQNKDLDYSGWWTCVPLGHYFWRIVNKFVGRRHRTSTSSFGSEVGIKKERRGCKGQISRRYGIAQFEWRIYRDLRRLRQMEVTVTGSGVVVEVNGPVEVVVGLRNSIQ